MDVLRPGHAHRSSSDRLLNNYLDSQKALATSLLTLLSHSHSSTSSLLAYVTSSPGVLLPVRRSVRHAAFEGPLSSALVDQPYGSQLGSISGDGDSPGWAAYVLSLEQFRKDLKQIHLLEEEMSRVKRDREILVTRLIKTTKSRPTKSDLSAIASSYAHSGRQDDTNMSSRASSVSLTSNGSAAGKEGKRTGKLQEAQAELLGCEEHLRGLEARIEHERNKVMMRGLEERFRAMDAVGRMWVGQAKRGLEDLDKVHELPLNAFELDSNGSIAPSQSASQIGYEDLPASPRRAGVPFPKKMHGPGSITGSIAEEDEIESSDDEAQGDLVVHENLPRGQASPVPLTKRFHTPAKASPLGGPSINSRTRPLSLTSDGPAYAGAGDDLGLDVPYRSGGRRAASDVGAMAYHPPTGRHALRRTFSEDRHIPNGRGAGSDTSSIRQEKKKKGFFASISRFFKGPKRREGSVRSGRDSPPYGSGAKGGWHTRTDTNIKRASSAFGRPGGGDESSSDEDAGNLVSVTNNRNSTWSVENVGRPGSRIKRSSTIPVASGLIPSKPSRSDLGGAKWSDSQSTITGRNAGTGGRSATILPGGQKALTAGAMSRSNTLKSTTSTATAKSGTGKKKARQNGSITRAAVGSQQAAEGRNIMSLVDMPAPPVLEVPKAPRSQVTPQMELAKAPRSSLLPSASAPKLGMNGDAHPAKSLGRSSSARVVPKAKQSNETSRTTTLPPSRMLSPPLKSAMRPSSPSTLPDLAPPLGPPKAMYTITAPGPVEVDREEMAAVPIPKPVSTAGKTDSVKPTPPPNTKRHSYHSVTTDGGSIYESAVEDEGPDGAAREDDSSSDEEDMEQGAYKIVENEAVAKAAVNVGPPEVVRIPSDMRDDESMVSDHTATGAAPLSGAKALPPAPAAAQVAEDEKVARRKSVRITAPDSPTAWTHGVAQPPIDERGIQGNVDVDSDRAPSPSPERTTDARWSTRIGRMREDTSEEEDEGEEYQRARKGLQRNSGRWEAIKGAREKLKKTKGKGGSARSEGSTKGRRAGNAKASSGSGKETVRV